jgi:hypothetical protein
MATERKFPIPDSLVGVPGSKNSRIKVITIQGIPGIEELELRGRKKIHLEIRTGNGNKILGHLELGSVSYWRDADEAGKGRQMFWEKFQEWMQFANQTKRVRH